MSDKPTTDVSVASNPDPYVSASTGLPQPYAGGGVYPFVAVTQSRSGHLHEVNDTLGSERLYRKHKCGTYEEITNDYRNVTVYGQNYKAVHGQDTVRIFGVCDIVIVGNCTQRVTGDYTLTVDGNYTEVINGTKSIIANKDMQIRNAPGGLGMHIDGKVTEVFSAGQATTVAGGVEYTVNGGMTSTINGLHEDTSTDEYIKTCGAGATMLVSSKFKTVSSTYDMAANTSTINVTGSNTLKAASSTYETSGGTTIKSGSGTDIDAGGDVTVTGSRINLN